MQKIEATTEHHCGICEEANRIATIFVEFVDWVTETEDIDEDMAREHIDRFIDAVLTEVVNTGYFNADEIMEAIRNQREKDN